MILCLLAIFLATGCPRGKDLPRRIDSGFEVAQGADLLGAVFADEDGWTAISEIRSNPIGAWNEFARRARSFTFANIAAADTACRATETVMHCAAASHPEGSTSEALVVTLTVGALEWAGAPCSAPSCGGGIERVMSIRYLQGAAAKTLPALPRGAGSAPVSRSRAARLLARSGAAFGGSVDLERPAPLSFHLPDGTVPLGTPVTGRCSDRQGLGLVLDVPAADKWIAETLSLPSAPRYRMLGADEVVSGVTKQTEGWRIEALGTRTPDGSFVVVDLCPTRG